ncbi:hypothetical protein [Azospirillum sp. sgz302134]
MAMMSVWKQIDPCHFVMQGGRGRIELRYHSAGHESGWGVYADGALVQRSPRFTEARGVALGLAAGA